MDGPSDGFDALLRGGRGGGLAFKRADHLRSIRQGLLRRA
jgi:hypothetical protein